MLQSVTRVALSAAVGSTAAVAAAAVSSSSSSSLSNKKENSSSNGTVSPGQTSTWAYGAARPQPTTKEPWDSLQGLLIGVRPTRPADVFDDRPVALGRLVAKVSETSYKVKFFKAGPKSNAGVLRKGDDAPPLTLDVGTRVTIGFEDNPISPEAVVHSGMYMKGTIAKVNGNATYTLLMDNDEVELSVAPKRIVAREPATKVFHNAKFLEMVGWLRSCVHDPRDVEATAFILFSRGWRVERLFLLEKVDLAQLRFISPIERDGISEKAQWERDHHNVIRMLHRERVKDRDWRYALGKYKGTISCISGVFVVSYVFTSNLRSYRRQQRGHQLKTAIKTLSTSVAGEASGTSVSAAADKAFVVERREEEALVASVLRQMVPSHPRIVVFTGSSGSGKSVLCRNAVRRLNAPAVHVDIRGAEDTLRSVVKALGVNNIEVCGDLLDFVGEAMRGATPKGSDRIPFLVMKLREGSSLEKVYRESVSLVSDYQACHIILEVPLRSLTVANVALPRLDFFYVPPFSHEQAFAYTQHMLNALDMVYFIETVGTNSNDLDELYAALRQRGVDPVAYTSLKLMKAMRRLRAALEPLSVPIRDAVKQLASMPFADGAHDETIGDLTVLVDPSLREFVVYDPVQDTWRFTQQVFHTAARCIII
ncbi:putative mitochondrial tuzin-like protein [Leptomonas pyrrhocoris]|uniref:Putative mitochondrial tuzin-like protein n=1 Tax=Leptomonas pyrrhocoris TaxID=157538 RepID=A0A0M9G4T2_LEPPY|nr:putative mitochondrial tuzin-like protein [Leptomonas pyrrhocoris]KPA82126.1 putative mitochondrial tuzin-like protein [Leptomonas pyrrhocoris]|eukprot:XP_015660565.1 putative mitochondrial tuzin-like protein [Leptomonas pyrrhocoris]